MSKTKFYMVWLNMKTRCYNSNCPLFVHYGARGITVSDSWLKFESFYNDMYTKEYQEAEKSGINLRKNFTLDRIDNNGKYCKENCKWSTMKEQNSNRRKPHIKRLSERLNKISLLLKQNKPISDIAKELGCSKSNVRWLIKHHLTK